MVYNGKYINLRLQYLKITPICENCTTSKFLISQLTIFHTLLLQLKMMIEICQHIDSYIQVTLIALWEWPPNH